MKQYTMVLSGPADGGYTFSRQLQTMTTDLSPRELAEVILGRRPTGTELHMGICDPNGNNAHSISWHVASLGSVERGKWEQS